MISEKTIAEYIDRINGILWLLDTNTRYSYKVEDGVWVLKHASEVICIEEDIELFFAHISFIWLWLKHFKLKIK